MEFDLLYVATAGSSWVVAQIIKTAISLKQDGLSWHDLLTSGGMPSSHTTLVTSVTLVIGLNQGFDSAIFGLALTVWGVVIYDSLGVRRATGENSRILQNISQQLKLGDHKSALFMALGHTPYQVFGGLVLGVIWGFVANWLF